MVSTVPQTWSTARPKSAAIVPDSPGSGTSLAKRRPTLAPEPPFVVRRQTRLVDCSGQSMAIPATLGEHLPELARTSPKSARNRPRCRQISARVGRTRPKLIELRPGVAGTRGPNPARSGSDAAPKEELPAWRAAASSAAPPSAPASTRSSGRSESTCVPHLRRRTATSAGRPSRSTTSPRTMPSPEGAARAPLPKAPPAAMAGSRGPRTHAPARACLANRGVRGPLWGGGRESCNETRNGPRSTPSQRRDQIHSKSLARSTPNRAPASTPKRPCCDRRSPVPPQIHPEPAPDRSQVSRRVGWMRRIDEIDRARHLSRQRRRWPVGRPAQSNDSQPSRRARCIVSARAAAAQAHGPKIPQGRRWGWEHGPPESEREEARPEISPRRRRSRRLDDGCAQRAKAKTRRLVAACGPRGVDAVVDVGVGVRPPRGAAPRLLAPVLRCARGAGMQHSYIGMFRFLASRAGHALPAPPPSRDPMKPPHEHKTRACDDL